MGLFYNPYKDIQLLQEERVGGILFIEIYTIDQFEDNNKSSSSGCFNLFVLYYVYFVKL